MARNRTPRGTNSVNGMGSITKVYKKNKDGKRYFAGYRAKFKPKDMTKYPPGCTPMFKPGQLGQARAWLQHEVDVYTQSKALGKPYVPPKERKLLERGRNINVAEYSKQFLDNYRSRITGEEVRASTMGTKRASHRHIVDYFGSKLLHEVTTKDVNDFSDWMLQYGRASRHNALKELKQMLRNAAMATDDAPALIPRNPMEGMVIPSAPESKQAKIPPATPEELEKLYDAMPAYTRISIKLGAWCGLRIGEVCALQVRDVDLSHRLLHVRHGLERGEDDRKLHLGAPKTVASNDTVNIPDSLVPLLRDHIRQHTDGKPDSMLLKPKRTDIMNADTLSRQFRRARPIAGRPDLHFHTLRATYDDTVSRVAQNAADYLASTRRHDVQTGVKHYQRSNADARRQITNAVDAALTGASSTPEQTTQTMLEQLEHDNRELLERLARLEQDNRMLREKLAALADQQ